jgi:hypothetical protein
MLCEVSQLCSLSLSPFSHQDNGDQNIALSSAQWYLKHIHSLAFQNGSIIPAYPAAQSLYFPKHVEQPSNLSIFLDAMLHLVLIQANFSYLAYCTLHSPFKFILPTKASYLMHGMNLTKITHLKRPTKPCVTPLCLPPHLQLLTIRAPDKCVCQRTLDSLHSC